MPAHVEIKARIPTVEALLPRAQALTDGEDHAQLIHQDDSFFTVPHGRLKLRVFPDGTGELIQYQRSDVDGPKRSEATIAEVSEPDSLRDVLERACGLLGRVRKTRILVLVGPARIHLDRVEGLGDFLEIEVALVDGQSDAEGRETARSLMHALGVDDSALVSGSYLDLVRDAAA